MKYLVVVPVACYRTGPGRFATESAFVYHLRTLLDMLSPPFTEVVLAGVQMSAKSYESAKGYMQEVDEQEVKISFVPLYDEETPTPRFLAQGLAPAVRKLRKLVAEAGLIHSGPSHNVWRPTEFASLMMGAAMGRKTISITDMDLRRDPEMLYKVGYWSRRTYLLCKYFYEPIRALQHQIIVRACSLVLFKGDSLVRDFGGGRESVKGIWDPGFSEEHLIPQPQLDAKKTRAQNKDAVLRLIYFGRFVFYKGIDHCLKAVYEARNQGARVSLSVMGAGTEEQGLRRLADELFPGEVQEGLPDEGSPYAPVSFVQAVPYGPEFFAVLAAHDVLMAAPLSVDTPRSVWDAFAAGMPIVAYDTEFYCDLSDQSGSVAVAKWAEPDALARSLVDLHQDRAELANMMQRARNFAANNTQEDWLERRVQWTREIL